MIYILLSITCNIIVSVLLKLARRYEVDVKQAIAWNYSIAAFLTWFFYRPQTTHFSADNLPFSLFISLGILLPSLFVVIAGSIRHTGIVRTDVAQRLSLLIPIFAAFLLFKEAVSTLKLTGISVGLAAVVCAIPWREKSTIKSSSSGWIYLLIVFAGMGIIDILFKQVAVFKGIPYTSSMFVIYMLAFLISILFLLFLFIVQKVKFSWKHVLAGWILGIANFGNILFYLKAHQAEANRPSLVFSAMNIGVIAAGSLVGLWLFNEKLSLLNKVGIGLAVIAILIITYA